jgi:hypothetical protein
MHARIRSLKGTSDLELQDISQRGMRVRNDGSLEPGLPVWIRLPNGRECRGVVRWAGASSAGLQLLDVLSADELGAVTRLWGVPVSSTEPGSSRTAISGPDCERSPSDS